MSFLFRLLGVLALVSSVGAATDQGGQFVTRSFDLVKKMLPLYELSSVRDRLLSEYEFSGSLPIPGDEQALGDFIREETRSWSGGRDPALDLLGNPYRLESGSEGDNYVFSNRHREVLDSPTE